MVRGDTDWRKGGLSYKFNPNPDMEPFYGVQGPEKGRLPVFRVTVTEAHCFAEWLGGRLPKVRQWRKAAGEGEDTRPGPFADNPGDKKDLGVGLVDGLPQIYVMNGDGSRPQQLTGWEADYPYTAQAPNWTPTG